VDASDPEVRRQNASTIDALFDLPVRHLPYPNPPSSARQRNCAIDRLSPSIEIVHFVDDDVTVGTNYFDAIRGFLQANPAAGGAGGVIQEPAVPSSSHPRLLKRLFLLDSSRRGRVLPSGQTTSAQESSYSTPSVTQTEWLSGCSCSFRRSLLEEHRFDNSLEGYSMLEDLDLSYRISRTAPLYVIPEARLVHHRSPVNRKDAEDYMYHQIVHRRWFVEKNLGRAFHRAAFWWATLGQALATRSSSRPEARAAYRGLVRGVRAVLRRDHPLLS
jgi:GT2 family glycosyltransferase